MKTACPPSRRPRLFPLVRDWWSKRRVIAKVTWTLACYRVMHGESPWSAWWRQLTACRQCHGTGVIGVRTLMHYSETPCPRKCQAIDRDQAVRIWSRYPPQAR